MAQGDANNNTSAVQRDELSTVIRNWLLQGGPIIALILLSAYLSFASEHFLTESNQVNILRRTSIVAILAVGQTFVILGAGIDLSVGATAALSASVSAVAMTQRTDIFGVEVGPVDFWIGLPLALLVGLLAGAINGLIITQGRIPDFIATLGTLEAFRGIALLVTGGLPIPSFSTEPGARNELPGEMIWLGSDDLLGIPVPSLVALGIVICSFVILRYTVLGRSVFAVGGNREAARVSGVHINRTKIMTYVISGLLAGTAGFLLAGRLNSANALMASGQELDSIAAVVIGGTNLFGGEGGVVGSVVGALIIGVLDNGLNLLNISDFWQRVIQGVVIVVVVVFDQWRRRRFGG